MTIPPLWKKIIYSVLLLVFVVAISFAIWWTFFRTSVEPFPGNENINGALVNGILPGTNVNVPLNLNTTVNGNINAVLPEISEVALGGNTLVSSVISDQTKGVTLRDGNFIYYDMITGKFYRVNAQGEKILLSDKTFFQVENVSWSPKGNQAVIEYPDGSNIYYDFDTQTQITLPPEFENIEFSRGGDQIAYKFVVDDPEDNWLGIANPDGSQIQPLERLGEKQHKVEVNWSPSGQVVATLREAADARRQEIYFIGLHGENFLSLEVDGRGFQGQWSPDGERILYSVFNSDTNNNPVLWISEASGDSIGLNNRSLGIQTWANKCTFGSASRAYCAVPRSLESGSGLYPETAISTPDDFYRVDLTTGAVLLIASPVSASGGQDFSAANPFLSDDGKILYFTDNISGELFSLRLE